MKRLAILTVLAILACWIASPQTSQLNTYTFICDQSPSAAAVACTVQQPATGSKNVQFLDAFVYSAAATDVTIARDGTAATATAGTVSKVNSEAATAAATVWTASNVGAGTTISTIPFAATGAQVIDLVDKQMRGDGTAKNLTIKSGSMTGRFLVVIRWKEY